MTVLMSRVKRGVSKQSKSLLVIAAAAAVPMFFFSSHAHAQFLTDNEGVSFDQVNYQDTLDGTTDADSGTGEISVNTAEALANAGIGSGGGYLNIADASGNWLVQNMPVTPGLSEMSTDFDLETPDGTADASDGATVEITTSPVATFAPGGGNEHSFAITEDTEEQAQGKGATVSGTVAPNLAQISFTIGGVTTAATVQFNHQNVQAADNQCVPAAYADGLTWLGTTDGLQNLAPNVPGRGALAGTLTNPNNPGGATYATNTSLILPNPNPNGNYSNNITQYKNQNTPFAGNPPYATYITSETPGNSLVAQMDLYMQRTTNNRSGYYAQVLSNGKYSIVDTNPGSSSPNELNGLTGYVNSIGQAANIDVYDQGQQGTQTLNNVSVTNNGNYPTAAFLINSLTSGYAVQLGYQGHEVSVVAGGYILGVPWIAYVSDHNQTDQGDPFDTSLGTANTANNLGGVDFAYIGTSGTGLALFGQSGTPMLQDDSAIQMVPEPASLGLLLAGLPIMLKRRRKTQPA